MANEINGYSVYAVVARRVLPLPAVVRKVNMLDELPNCHTRLLSRLARSASTILATGSRASPLVISLTKPMPLLLFLPSTFQRPIHRFLCVLTPPRECRVRIFAPSGAFANSL